MRRLFLVLLCLSGIVRSSERHNIYEDEYDTYLRNIHDFCASLDPQEPISLRTPTPVSPLRGVSEHASSTFDYILAEALAGESFLASAITLGSPEYVYAYVVVMDHLRGYPLDANLIRQPSVRSLLISHNVMNSLDQFISNLSSR